MVPMGPWIYSYRKTGDIARKNSRRDTGLSLSLFQPGGTQATYLEVKPIMINATTKEKSDSWELIKLLCSTGLCRDGREARRN